MKLIKLLELIWAAIQILILIVLGIGVLGGGIYEVIISQTETFEKEYQTGMHLGLGILFIIVGLPVAWACLVHIVTIYRNY